MPFPDEAGPVEVVAYRHAWTDDFDVLAALLHRSDAALTVDHVGSTSVPSLAAKDVIDAQVRVAELDREGTIEQFSAIGLRWRPDPWNNVEQTRDGPEPKLVFAPPPGERRANIHVRVDGTKGATDTLLFRDFLRHDDAARDAWSAFKHTIVRTVPDIGLLAYGQIKQPAWAVLMLAADRWARDVGWVRPRLV